LDASGSCLDVFISCTESDSVSGDVVFIVRIICGHFLRQMIGFQIRVFA
jgi:hypothetical protein